MKKIIALLIVLTLALSLCIGLTSCKDNDEATKIRIGCMTGPTGMGMAKLIVDNGGINGNDKYEFTLYTDTVAAKNDLASGKIDLICYPTNDAANFYHSVDNNVSVISINTLCSLFLLTDGTTAISSFEELNGKTVYTCKNGTPRMILQYLVDLYDLDITVSYTVDGKEMATPFMLREQIILGNVDIAVAPEPIVTAATLQNKSYSVDLDLSDAWNAKIETELAMGCLIGNRDFISQNKTEINAFLDEYKTSIEYMSNPDNIDSASNYCQQVGIMEKAAAAKKALLNLGDAISYRDGDEMKEALIVLYNALNIEIPNDEFFYKK